MNEQVDTILNELRSRLENLYGNRFVKLILFGSYARKEPEIGSDIDVMVVLKGQVKAGDEIARVIPITASLSLLYDVVISCVYISENRYSSEQSPLLLNVRREGVVL
ncbi:MAG: nucleotidyltransferase domain-containing protein [Calditrichaeota bacterium]|nr:nucleotidyltransferase domain-containing protein [Calditrichota bacterium]